MKYISGTGELPNCNIEICKKKLAAMKEAGFSVKFIKSRFLIESINKLVLEGHVLDDVLAALKLYTKEEAKFAEDQRSLHLLEKKVKEVEEAKNN